MKSDIETSKVVPYNYQLMFYNPHSISSLLSGSILKAGASSKSTQIGIFRNSLE